MSEGAWFSGQACVQNYLKNASSSTSRQGGALVQQIKVPRSDVVTAKSIGGKIR